MIVPLTLLVCAALVVCVQRVYVSIKNVNVLLPHISSIALLSRLRSLSLSAYTQSLY